MNLEELHIKGLSDNEVLRSREINGTNRLSIQESNKFIEILKAIFTEPMVVLLLAAALIYFITGHTGDAIFMVGAIILVSAISIYQDTKSKNAISQLKQLTIPKCEVIRNGIKTHINVDDLVVNDIVIVSEGNTIPADGLLLEAYDFTVNEAVLTGESASVAKDKEEENKLYRGTQVTTGMAIFIVREVGNQTKLGKIGLYLKSVEREKSPLQLQINRFVKGMVLIGSAFFIVVWLLNYLKSYDVLDSLLKALTMAMSVLPEEIPVAFTTFMAIGSYRLLNMGVIVKDMKTVEALGNANIICADKTGTLTLNRMELSRIYSVYEDRVTFLQTPLSGHEKYLIEMAMWASEPIPFDPMEKSIHDAYKNSTSQDLRSQFRMIHEYPLEGKPPMMTHIYSDDSKKIIATKGGLESILRHSTISPSLRDQTLKIASQLSNEGLRILGVAHVSEEIEHFPARQSEFNLEFLGLIAFLDPPKSNISKVIDQFNNAGIITKIVTGDNDKTTRAIARNIGWKDPIHHIDGEKIMELEDSNLKDIISSTSIFTRMYPEAKVKVVEALKSMGNIVAMTGDGVNDAPALKAAHIGIAMGKRGTEIAKSSASLILKDDDLGTMVDAITMGRRIHSNLKKAIRYIISIHIPIILIVSVPLILGWVYPNIFTPVHVITLELIMGPTCSIIYENEPIEKNLMIQPPRALSYNFFNRHELMVSTIQGIMITVGTLGIYLWMAGNGNDEDTTRTGVFTTLITANVFLTLVNRSFYYSFWSTLGNKNPLLILMLSITLGLMVLMLLYEPVRNFFKFARLDNNQLLWCFIVGSVSVFWYEWVKLYSRRKKSNIE